MTIPYRRRGNRLPAEVYTGNAAYFVTTSLSGHRRAFVNRDAVDLCLSALSQCSERYQLDVYAYCFMPSHVHLLLVAETRTSVAAFMRDYKQISGFYCNRLLGWRGPFWQKSYHDHVLRRAQDLESVAKYIWSNPVRAGLVSEVGQYPFSGSLVVAGPQ